MDVIRKAAKMHGVTVPDQSYYRRRNPGGKRTTRRGARRNPLQYRTVDTRTVKGIEEAERLQAAGWKIVRSGMFSIQFERKVAPKGRGARRRKNPAGWGTGRDYQSLGPIKTVAQLRAVARELLRFVRPDSRMASAANLALRSPDYFLARPDSQRELLDFLRVYAGAAKIPATVRRLFENPKRARRVKRNRPRYSEQVAWETIAAYAANAIRQHRQGKSPPVALFYNMETVAERMLDQLERGIHANPTLAIFGNPPRGKVKKQLGRVVEVRYKRDDDGKLYFHKYTSRPRLCALSDGSIWITP